MEGNVSGAEEEEDMEFGSYEAFGGSQDFMELRPLQNPIEPGLQEGAEHEDFSGNVDVMRRSMSEGAQHEDFPGNIDVMRCISMGNVSTKREGGEEVEVGSYEVLGGSQDFMRQSPARNPIGTSFSPIIFTHQGGLLYEDFQRHINVMSNLSTPTIPLQRVDEMSSTDEALMQKSNEEQEIATMLTWSYGGKEVLVEGSWDNWKTKEHLQRSKKDFVILKVLPSGVYHYRFIVDGERRCSTEIATIQDEKGNVYNILELKAFVPENLEHRKEFEQPPSPKSSYNCPPDPADNSKEPPILPELLGATILNSPSDVDSSTSRSGPHYSTLGHLYIDRNQRVVALASTDRFQDKYITAVIYKPSQG